MDMTLRADAERNRARIVAAAREVFAERGLDAPLEEVARRSGVGVATLYRRVPPPPGPLAPAAAAQKGAHPAPAAAAPAPTAPRPARRSGVGVATLYRRFPTRDDLIAGAFEAKMGAYADAVDAALAETDPWQGFRRFVERIAAMQAADRGFTGVLTMTFPNCREFD